MQENHYYPFGLNMNYAWMNNNTLPDTRYQYNGKELNDDFGLNWNDYGARWYDAAVGRWWSVDPLAEKYAKWPLYCYTVDDPVKFIDLDGRQIIIRYQDEDGKKRKATYDPSKGIATNKKGEEVHGKFLDQTVESLNYAQRGDVNGIINSLSENSKRVTIKETSKEGAFFVSGRFGRGNSTVYYNPTSALKTGKNLLSTTISGTMTTIFRPDGGAQTPALGLLHELGHNYENWNHRHEQKARAKEPNSEYNDQEEKFIIQKYENPGAKALNESPRENHGGIPYESVGPTSTEEKKQQ